MDPMKGISGGPVFEPRHAGGQGVKEGEFLETLKSFYQHVDEQIRESGQMASEFAVGKRNDIHEIMVASEKAGLSFRLLLQIRNKLLEAYQELMRMQF
jgi:flagellar hook-basal body complex protein FliE